MYSSVFSGVNLMFALLVLLQAVGTNSVSINSHLPGITVPVSVPSLVTSAFSLLRVIPSLNFWPK